MSTTDSGRTGEGAQRAQAAITSPVKLALAVRRMRSKAGGIRLLNSEPIAIVGLGCRYPGGVRDAESFWSLLQNGVDAITQVPPERWDVDAFYDPNPDAPGKTYSRWGGFLEDVDRFDSRFFGISPREVSSMDPQQRLLLEVSWEALEQGGQIPARLAGTQTGVFVGISQADYAQLFRENRCTDVVYAGTGNALSVAAGRIAYLLGLHGPTLAVDTACSSSLVAVHLACQSLRAEECRVALAGGVNLVLTPAGAIYFSKVRAMAPDGRCKTFDAAADGYVRAEGCGMVVLKRLSDAVADGDRVLALIRGSAVNHDGPSSGLTVPNGPAQQAVIRGALAAAGMEPRQVKYVEAHGSGTPLGDPIEFGALAAVYGESRPSADPLIVGALKTNIGHTESAAGIGGLIKVVLAMQHGEIPPHLHFKTPNPHISLEQIPAVVPTRPMAWPAAEKRRVGAVSSFGLSGTNAHVVLEETPPEIAEEESETEPDGRTHVLAISAKSVDGLRALARAYQSWLPSHPAALSDICFTANCRRSHHDHRLALVGASREELGEKLAESVIEDGGLTPARRIAFVFSGQGSQWCGMGRELIATEPAFRDALTACDTAIRRYVDWSLVEILNADEADPRLQRTDVIQPTLFAVQVALAALWASWGIKPRAVLGHSMGEVAAAHVAGALSLDDAARVITLRSALLGRADGRGAMAMVELSFEDTQRLLEGYEDRVAIAASNGPRATIVSGEPGAIGAIVEELGRRDVFCRSIRVDVAAHSPQMDPMAPELLSGLPAIEPRPPLVPFYSTITGEPCDGQALDAAYWVRNLRQPVRFWPALQRLRASGHDLFVEVSPHPILLHAIDETRGTDANALASMRRGEPERTVMAESLASLYAAGQNVNWDALYPSGRCVSVPLYQWQRQRFWLETPSEEESLSWSPASRPRAVRGHPLLGEHLQSSVQPATHFWETAISLATLPWLGDHRVEGLVLMPAAAYVEMTLAAGAEALGSDQLVVEDLKFQRPLVVAEDQARTLQVVLAGGARGTSDIQISVRQGHDAWELVATGRVRIGQAPSPSFAAVDEILARCAQHGEGAPYYEALSRQGLEYGPAFRGITRISRRDGEAIAALRAPGAVASASDAYQIHPALLDAAFQTLAAAVPNAEQYLRSGHIYLPVKLASLNRSGPLDPGTTLWAHAIVRSPHAVASDHLEGDVSLCDETGHVLVHARGLEIQRVQRETAAPDTLRDWLYEIEWQRKELADKEATAVDGTWLILADQCGVGDALRARLAAGGARSVVAVSGEQFERVGEERYILRAGEPKDFRRLLDETSSAEWRGIVHCWSIDAESSETMTVQAIEHAQVLGCGSVLHLVQAIERSGWGSVPRLWMVTRDAQAVDGGIPVAVAQAPIWGLGRSIALELPELRCTRIDLTAADSTVVDGLYRELCADGREDQVAWRGGARHVARLTRPALDVTSARTVTCGSEGQSFRLEITTPGILDHLAFRRTDRQQPGPGQIEIEVGAAGLNFNDVMKAMGVYPGLPDGPVPLGHECAGTVVSIGPDVNGVAIGDEVVAVAPFSFGSHVTTSAHLVAPKPSALTFEQAAAIPLACMTAVYALRHLARLEPGERVLIHAATGGVGLAAVQLAQRAGAEIFATAGTPEKRAHLAALGVRHVMDSRSLRFADEVLERTDGRGVDVVLNSLAGDAIGKSLDVLAPFGRFLELGKRDIYENRAIGLSPFQKQLSYFAIDLARLFVERPAVCVSLFREVMQGFADGTFAPLPLHVFPIARAADAFREMAQARHIGKIVVSLQDRGDVMLTGDDDGPRFRPDASYLITGGLRGLGLSVAGWMAARGARHLALIGIAAPSDEALAGIAALQERGVSVAVLLADVSVSEQVKGALDSVAQHMPPLAGIIHAAGLIDDGLLSGMTWDRFQRVIAPKIAGAWNLHALTAENPLDFFVMFSSAASMLGSAGQANYSAANAFLDGLAHRRLALGMPALSVNWGPWSGVGIAARTDQSGRLGQLGIMSITPGEGVEALGRLLGQSKPQLAVIRLQPQRWLESYPAAADWPFLAELLREVSLPARRAGQGSEVRSALLAIDPGPRRLELLEAHLREQLAQVLRLDASQVERLAPLQSMGMDSLMALELRNRLEASLGLTLSATLVWGYPTVAALAPHLAAKMGVSLEAVHTPAPDTPPVDERQAAMIEELKQLSDEDAEALLIQELGSLGGNTSV